MARSKYHWKRITDQARFAARDGAGALVFQDQMWLLGGWNPHNKKIFPKFCNSEVWSSCDGKEWTLRANAPWEGRHVAGYAVHRGRMWVVGGDPNQGHYQNDVWSSADGCEWRCETREVPWGPRSLHLVSVWQDKLWVIGGQTMPQFVPDGPDIFYSDVWNSKDGIHWQQVADNLEWAPRGIISGDVVFQNKLWLVAGGTYSTPSIQERRYYNDVWSSADGQNWMQIAASTPWPPRQFHSVAVFDNMLWVLGGCDLSGNRRDVWYSPDGVHWNELPDTPWIARHATSVFVFDNALWVVAGDEIISDVWKLTIAVDS